MKLTKITASQKKSSVTVSDSVFAQPMNSALLSQAVRVYRSNKRQGTSKVKTRSEINLTKRKWFKQKGTGNARHGAQSAPIFVGGGVAHGPKGNENWSKDLSKKMKRQAARIALSAQAENTVVVDGFSELTGKTKQASQLLTTAVGDKKANTILVVVADDQKKAVQGFRNIEGVQLVHANDVNALNIAGADVIVMATEAVKVLEARLESATKQEKK